MTAMTIRSRLMITLGILCAALVGIGALSVNGLRKTVHSLESVYNDRVVALEQIKHMADAYAVNIVNTANKVLNGTILFPKAVENVDSARKVIRENWSNYRSTGLVEEEKELIARIDPMLRVADLSVGELREILERQDRDSLQEFHLNRLYPAIDPISGLLDQLSQLQLKIAKQEYEGGASIYRVLTITTIAVTLAAVVLAVIVGFFLVRAITQPLNHAVHVARTVADGDLTVRIDSASRDETGQLLEALRKMKDDLAETVGSIQTAASNVHTGSQEIARGNGDLSSRTEEQASSLEETASSMEELTSTVKQNADNARQANQLAIGASDVATKGGEVVGKVVTRMSEITDSSKKIEDIISVIEGIAFQTNILALNAAVEAARAGEQGRGFAVVASEVRSLAQRSSSAAKEIKALISDSVERIEDGSKLVEQAGKTMEEIVTSVKRVTDIMAEISAASQEQSSGIGQVNETISSMDEATQQNAALVEQSSAAARSLLDQGAELSQSVARFRISEMLASEDPIVMREPARKPAARPAPAAKAAKPEPKAPKQAPVQIPKKADDGEHWAEF